MARSYLLTAATSTAISTAIWVLAIILGGPTTVAAEATHSGTFNTAAAGSTVIYSTAVATPVMLTLCQTSAGVATQVVVDSSAAFAVSGCRTMALTVGQSIQVSSSAPTTGVYTISIDLTGAR